MQHQKKEDLGSDSIVALSKDCLGDEVPSVSSKWAMVSKGGEKFRWVEYFFFDFTVRAIRGDGLDVGKELCRANKNKGIGLDSRKDVANLLGAKDSVALAGQVGNYVDNNGRPCLDLMLCPQEEPFVCEPLVCCPP